MDASLGILIEGLPPIGGGYLLRRVIEPKPGGRLLSIRFKPGHEWWVSGKIFDRFFNTAFASGKVPPRFHSWGDEVNANGGFSLSNINPSEATALITVLCDTAEQEISRLERADPSTEDGSYRIALQRLLKIISS